MNVYVKNSKKCYSKIGKNRDKITYFTLFITGVFLRHKLERRNKNEKV